MSSDNAARFLRELRQLRSRAGLGHAELAARSHYPYDRIKAAEAGPSLPDLPVLSAYVRGCGGTTEEWEERWRTLRGLPAQPLLATRAAGYSAAVAAGARRRPASGPAGPEAVGQDTSAIMRALGNVAREMAAGQAPAGTAFAASGTAADALAYPQAATHTGTAADIPAHQQAATGTGTTGTQPTPAEATPAEATPAEATPAEAAPAEAAPAGPAEPEAPRARWTPAEAITTVAAETRATPAQATGTGSAAVRTANTGTVPAGNTATVQTANTGTVPAGHAGKRSGGRRMLQGLKLAALFALLICLVVAILVAVR